VACRAAELMSVPRERHGGRSLQRLYAATVMNFAARLIAAVTVALTLRAAAAQQFQPGGQRRDPYSPPPAGQPAVNQSLRYPLPPQTSAPPIPPLAPNNGPPPDATQRASYGPATIAPPQQPVPFQRGQIVARVGDKTIFYGDVAPTVNLIIEPVLAKAKSDEERQAIEANREPLTRNEVRLMVRSKMLLCEFERSIPANARADAKKFAATKANIDKKIRTMFEKTLDECRERVKDATPEQTQNLLAQERGVVRLALLMKERKLESLGELDQALRQYGSSLDAQARDFGESKLGMQAIFSQITKSPEVTHQEMLDYYEAHAAEYAIEPKARFEILSVKFANFRTRAEAENAIAAMGNAVYLGGVPFDAVARKHSQEPRAAEGGQYDGITKGSLASKTIDQAVFSLEVGKLSQVIEDETGLHILRVKERQEATQVSFVEAQEKIRKAIQAQKRGAEEQKLLAELSARTSVWTIYDPPTEVATQPAGTTPR
jgi:parvulin-like peptidyl-prolyl isomerase